MCSRIFKQLSFKYGPMQKECVVTPPRASLTNCYSPGKSINNIIVILNCVVVPLSMCWILTEKLNCNLSTKWP